MESDQVTALADALAHEGWWYVLVRQTEEGEKYIDLAASPTADPVASVWFDPSGLIVWGDEYEFSTQVPDPLQQAKTILYTIKDN